MYSLRNAFTHRPSHKHNTNIKHILFNCYYNEKHNIQQTTMLTTIKKRTNIMRAYVHTNNTLIQGIYMRKCAKHPINVKTHIYTFATANLTKY